MSKLTLEGLTGGKDSILEGVQTHPAFRRCNGNATKALAAAAAYVEETCVFNVADAIHTALVDAYETHVAIYGPAEDITDATGDEWHGAVDDAMEEALSPWASILSADWLGRKTVDTRVHEEDALDDLARSAGAEAFKQIAGGRKPGQLLAALDVLKADMEALLAVPRAALDPDEVRVKTIGVLHRILTSATGAGVTLDPLDVYDELDSITDPDDALADGAAQRLRASGADKETLRDYRALHPVGALDTLTEMFAELQENPSAYEAELNALKDADGDAEKSSAPPPPPPPPSAAATATATATAHEGLPPEVLSRLKQYANVKDKDVAEKLGMSRATFNNKVNGKGDPITDPGHIATIREILSEYADGLAHAVRLLDGEA